MLSFLSELIVLFAIVAVVLLVVGQRRGWFVEVPGQNEPAQPPVTRAPVSDKLARQIDGTSATIETESGSTGTLRRTSLKPTALSRLNPLARRPPRVQAPPPAEPAVDIHPAVLAAAREKAISGARASISDHWAIDKVQNRSGWMAFRPPDFLGSAATTISYQIPGSPTPGVLELFPIREIRRVEKGDTVVAASRRKVITGRWQERRKRLATAASRTKAANSSKPAQSKPE